MVWTGVVLSVAKLALGQESYYERQVAGGLDDYYAGRGESPGIWTGEGARELSLAGTVADGSLGTLLRGVDPATGQRLRAPVRERITTVRVLDLASGAWRSEERRLAPVSGYDLVFSCPKSVSLLHALTDDERVRRAVSEAHESAWQAALAYLEREACVLRRGRGGAVRERGAGFVAAAFRHRTSRAQEPHLHTHVIVANLARSPDGRYRALDGEAILRTYRLAAGYLYEAQLRHELGRSLGLRFTEPVKGMAELEDVPEEALVAFSTRRQALLEHMRAHESEGFAAARIAALATRQRKEEVDLSTLRERWRARAGEHGLGECELVTLVRAPSPHRELDLAVLAERLLTPAGLTEKRTTFTMPELVRAVAGASPQSADAAQVIAAAEALSRRPEVEPITPELAPGRPARFTTRELIGAEHEALGIALAGRAVGAPSVERRLLDATISAARPVLSREQGALVRAACLSPDRVVCAVGAAGAGKTTALRVLHEAFRGASIPILGAAPSGRAADELQTATGVPSVTLHRLLLDAERQGGLPPGCVLVIDEAGMAETRVLTPALRLVDETGGKAVLVGDPAQLPAVGAGGLYIALAERLGAVEVSRNLRQRDPQESQALTGMRAGNVEDYLEHLARTARLCVEKDSLSAKERLAEDWWECAQEDLPGTVMLAYRREDVDDLNAYARGRMLAAGRLGPERLVLGGREFRAGDRVLCRRNDAGIRVRNGTRGTILGVERTLGALTVKTDVGAVRHFPASYAECHLDHGYALTGHAAQGASMRQAFVLLRGEGALAEWAYVACSRAREETRLYGARDELDAVARDTETSVMPPLLVRALARSALAARDAGTRALTSRFQSIGRGCAPKRDRRSSASRRDRARGFKVCRYNQAHELFGLPTVHLARADGGEVWMFA